MKKIFRFFGILAVLLFYLSDLTSCQNGVDDNIDPSKYYLSSGVVIAPDAVIWSGSKTYTNSFNDNSNVYPYSITETRAENINKEVEVHLSLQPNNNLTGSMKYEISDLTSILSIYVRYPKDVEVIIPVSEEIYCDQEAINNINHETYNYKGEKISYTNPVGDKSVTLNVEYIPSNQDDLTNPNGIEIDGYGVFKGGYIRVTTDGIDEDVLNYCKEYYDDGMNFKIYNYYHRNNKGNAAYSIIDKSGLQNYFLNHSLVNFDWQNMDINKKTYPAQYVNAISSDALGNPIDSECYVWILGDNNARTDDNGLLTKSNQQLKNGMIVTWNEDGTTKETERDYFNDPYQGNHYNNSPFNLIYTLKESY